MEQREAEGEKVNNAVLFDQAGCDKMLVEVPKYKMITPVLCDTLRAPKKEKAPPLASKSAKSSEGKQKKKKWSIGKHKKKVNNAVFFDQASYDKILVEVPKYKMITSVLCDRLRQVPVCQQDCRQSVVPMVQCQRREKSRLPSNLSTFSAFSRVLYLVGSSSVTKARLSKRPEKENGVLERPAKIRRPESSSSVCDNKEQDQQEEAIVQADFAFFDPKPSDFHGVKLLLQSYLDDKPWDLSGFVDLILGQPTVGTVVKLDAGDQDCEEDGDDGDNEDIYGVITALNLGRYGDHQCMVELREFLLAVCGDENMKMKLKVLLEQNPYGVGLLVSQRFVNCPHELIPPLYDALFDEVSWATEDEPTEKLRDSFQFRFYLLVTRIYELKHAKQCNAKTKLDCHDPIIYLKAEDEIFHEMSFFSFTFPLHASRFVPYELKKYRSMGLIMIITADAVPKFREKLKSLLAET